MGPLVSSNTDNFLLKTVLQGRAQCVCVCVLPWSSSLWPSYLSASATAIKRHRKLLLWRGQPVVLVLGGWVGFHCVWSSLVTVMTTGSSSSRGR